MDICLAGLRHRDLSLKLGTPVPIRQDLNLLLHCKPPNEVVQGKGCFDAVVPDEILGGLTLRLLSRLPFIDPGLDNRNRSGYCRFFEVSNAAWLEQLEGTIWSTFIKSEKEQEAGQSDQARRVWQVFIDQSQQVFI